MNEIYDIAGNLFEYTTDIFQEELSIARGGTAVYSSKKEESEYPVEGFNLSGIMHYVLGFRVVLYIL